MSGKEQLTEAGGKQKKKRGRPPGRKKQLAVAAASAAAGAAAHNAPGKAAKTTVGGTASGGKASKASSSSSSSDEGSWLTTPAPVPSMAKKEEKEPAGGAASSAASSEGISAGPKKCSTPGCEHEANGKYPKCCINCNFAGDPADTANTNHPMYEGNHTGPCWEEHQAIKRLLQSTIPAGAVKTEPIASASSRKTQVRMDFDDKFKDWMQPEITPEELKKVREEAAQNIRKAAITFELMPRALQVVMNNLDDADKLSGLTMLERDAAKEFLYVLRHIGLHHCTHVDSVVGMCKPAVEKVLAGESLEDGKNIIDLRGSTNPGRTNFGTGLYATMTIEKARQYGPMRLTLKGYHERMVIGKGFCENILYIGRGIADNSYHWRTFQNIIEELLKYQEHLAPKDRVHFVLNYPPLEGEVHNTNDAQIVILYPKNVISIAINPNNLFDMCYHLSGGGVPGIQGRRLQKKNGQFEPEFVRIVGSPWTHQQFAILDSDWQRMSPQQQEYISKIPFAQQFVNQKAIELDDSDNEQISGPGSSGKSASFFGKTRVFKAGPASPIAFSGAAGGAAGSTASTADLEQRLQEALDKIKGYERLEEAFNDVKTLSLIHI